jgi:cytochrome c peroxidase
MPTSNPKQLYLILTSLSLLLAFWGATTVLAQAPLDSVVALPTPELPANSYNYANITLPNHFNTPQLAAANNTPAANPITNAGATLGRVLFYDKRLSANNTIACGSCHHQANGFSDPVALSSGFAGGLTGRNSMGLSNARYYQNGTFFWDERADSLESQTLMPIQDSVEMGLTLPELVAKVEVESYYPPLFEQAFGSPQVSSDRISRALAQFVRSMVSYQAKYDQGVATNFSNFTPQENLGRQIFNGRGRCDTCHTTDLFIAPTARNNGLDLVLTDNGLGNVTGNPADNGKFKVPSLRNIALTGPYMHDGRFATLAEVVAFYNNGVQASPNLDQRLRQNNGQPRRLNLNQNEQAALVAFLNTLTDPTFVAEAKFSDPFLVLSNRVYLPLVTK